MKYFIAFIVLFNLLVYGCKGKAIIPDTNENFAERGIDKINVKQITVETFYVAPHNGLNLQTEPSLSGARIRTLQQYTKLTVIDMSFRKETIDGISDYWYEVDTGEESGWVFGGYLISNVSNNNVILERPILVEDQRYFEFSNGQKIKVWDDNSSIFYEIDYIKVYDKTTKTSDYFEIYDTSVQFFKLDENDDWLYLINDTDFKNINGFVFIYDISEKSFYGISGDIELPGYSPFKKAEYKITREYGNIKRFGPLLLIYYDYGVIRFGDSFNGEAGKKDYIIGYYPEYNEILIARPGMESIEFDLFNLGLNRYVGEDIGYPFFSPLRDYVISLYHPIYDWDESSLRIYSRKKGIYEIIYETEDNFKIDLNRYRNTDVVSWISDNEIKINFGEVNAFFVEINNNKVKISD